VRYADDFVVLVHGTEADAHTLREQIADVLAPMGLRLSESKTRVVHMSDGFEFLGFHIRWKRKRGTRKWHVYTFVADRPVRAVKAKIRALTRRSSNADLKETLRRINQVLRGWCNYFRHGVSKATFSYLDEFAWRRVTRWLRRRHNGLTWKALARREVLLC
jgi:RNA-directed DNA polymerase